MRLAGRRRRVGVQLGATGPTERQPARLGVGPLCDTQKMSSHINPAVQRLVDNVGGESVCVTLVLVAEEPDGLTSLGELAPESAKREAAELAARLRGHDVQMSDLPGLPVDQPLVDALEELVRALGGSTAVLVVVHRESGVEVALAVPKGCSSAAREMAKTLHQLVPVTSVDQPLARRRMLN